MSTDQDRINLSITLADALAAHVLIDKLDKQGKPLIDHVRRVAAAVKVLPTSSHEQHIAALLHDVIEETANDPNPISITAIDTLFGRTVGNTVATLTRTPDREYQSYIEIVALYPHARAIKLADLEDNLDASRGPIEPSLKARYERARQLLIDQEEYERQIRGGNPAAINPHPQAKG